MLSIELFQAQLHKAFNGTNVFFKFLNLEFDYEFSEVLYVGTNLQYDLVIKYNPTTREYLVHSYELCTIYGKDTDLCKAWLAYDVAWGKHFEYLRIRSALFDRFQTLTTAFFDGETVQADCTKLELEYYDSDLGFLANSDSFRILYSPVTYLYVIEDKDFPSKLRGEAKTLATAWKHYGTAWHAYNL